MQGTASEKVKWMDKINFVTRSVEDLSKFGDIMPVGFGDDRMINHELAEPEGEGRRWNDHGPRWVNMEGNKDQLLSTLTWAVRILPEGKPLWGGPCLEVEFERIDVRQAGARETNGTLTTRRHGKKKSEKSQ